MFSTQSLHGNVGLLFTNKSLAEVKQWFEHFTDHDFARAGFTSEEEIQLLEGPLERFSHSTEPQLRKLGLPTSLKKGMLVRQTIVRVTCLCEVLR